MNLPRCGTCKFCDVHSKIAGFCHGGPPQFFPARFVKVDGGDKIDHRPEFFIQYLIAQHSAFWPHVDPRAPGCRVHKFSLKTWLQHRRAPDLPPEPVFVQQKPGA